jgi:hypothetical protein
MDGEIQIVTVARWNLEDPLSNPHPPNDTLPT